MWWTKSRNSFENIGDQIFSQICLGDEISWKLRQVWTETQHRGWDETNNWGKKFNFVL